MRSPLWSQDALGSDPVDTIGSAGCALANRLSADPNRRVLLIEAGPDYAGLDELPEDLRDVVGTIQRSCWRAATSGTMPPVAACKAIRTEADTSASARRACWCTACW